MKLTAEYKFFGILIVALIVLIAVGSMIPQFSFSIREGFSKSPVSLERERLPVKECPICPIYPVCGTDSIIIGDSIGSYCCTDHGWKSPPETEDKYNCNDGLDNDCNMKTDNMDPYCHESPAIITVCKNGTCDAITIQEAFNLAKGTDIVKIMDNEIYYENSLAFPSQENNITLDCSGSTISSIGGLWIIRSVSNDNIIKNCNMIGNEEITYGVAYWGTGGGKVINNSITNSPYGIHLWNSELETFTDNTICNNSNYDLYCLNGTVIEHYGNVGDSNSGCSIIPTPCS